MGLTGNWNTDVCFEYEFYSPVNTVQVMSITFLYTALVL